MKSGFVTIAGLANAGKSTLINTLVGEKVAIVSWRPQTTRNKIVGIVNGDDHQIVFIDTPGIHEIRNQLSEFMMQSIYNSLKDVEAVLYVIDTAKGLRKEDYEFIENYAGKTPLIVVLNKEDTVTRETMFFNLEKLNRMENIHAVVPISAKKKENIQPLLDILLALMPEGEQYYPEDMYTESSMRFMASEIVREKALYLLNKEIPYGIGVYINKFELREDKPIYDIDADIICERQSHKAIIIGKKGEMLKKIASNARVDLEELTGEKVFLTLYVKVNAEWRDSDFLMRELGYDLKMLKKDN